MLNLVRVTSLSLVCNVWKSLNFLVTTQPSDVAPSWLSGIEPDGVVGGVGASDCEQWTTITYTGIDLSSSWHHWNKTKTRVNLMTSFLYLIIIRNTVTVWNQELYLPPQFQSILSIFQCFHTKHLQAWMFDINVWLENSHKWGSKSIPVLSIWNSRCLLSVIKACISCSIVSISWI